MVEYNNINKDLITKVVVKVGDMYRNCKGIDEFGDKFKVYLESCDKHEMSLAMEVYSNYLEVFPNKYI